MNEASRSDVEVASDEELLKLGISRVRLPQDVDWDKWAHLLSRPTLDCLAFEGDNEFALYRNIMDEADFPFNSISNSSIATALVQSFEIDSFDELRLDDAFCMHYSDNQQDTTGKRHRDPSDITVNMCLHKSTDCVGSLVVFHFEQRGSLAVEQLPGYATIHRGDIAHETTELLRGSRTNVILTYFFKDTSRSKAAPRTCYK